MGAPGLQYEPHAAGRPVFVEHDGGWTRIVVPMQGLYAPVPRWMGDLELLALVLIPVWWITALIVRTCLRVPKPPRAVFEVSDERVRITLRHPGSGEGTAFDWPRAAVVEARANRYDRGLLNVTGHVKDTYLADLSRESIELIEAALRDALARSDASPALAEYH